LSERMRYWEAAKVEEPKGKYETVTIEDGSPVK
jgi:hypothetical protein